MESVTNIHGKRNSLPSISIVVIKYEQNIIFFTLTVDFELPTGAYLAVFTFYYKCYWVTIMYPENF